jgi:prepilin-type N-terminal cleavage/methylation domain-containing protein
MLSTLRKRLRSEKGFTLIELLVVMIILAILTAIAVPSYLSFRDRANSSASGADVRAIVPSIESYYADKGTYVGMTVAGLQASYDQAIQTSLYTLNGLSTTSYCISAVINSKYAKKVGPAGTLQTNLSAGC